MRKRNWFVILLAVVGAAIAGIVLVFLGVAFFLAQRADYGWDPGLPTPTFVASHPRVLVDEAHGNASTIGFTGRYWPFGRLLRADGFDVVRGTQVFTPATLAGVDVLVIANASGAARRQVFGMNIPTGGEGKRSDPAFTPAEVEVIRSWIRDGGALLLIADHAPFGEASEALGAALGVVMHKGFMEVPGESSDPLLFSRDNGRLGDHPIIRGRAAPSAIARVMTYTGQSLDGPPGASVLLRLPGGAVEAVPDNDALVERPAGRAQGLAFKLGKGRVVVLGEGAMVTAQVSRRVPYGMNTDDNDNRQFVLNTLYWLSRNL